MMTAEKIERLGQMKEYSGRMKTIDLKRWNRAQVLIARRLGIGREVAAMLSLAIAFAEISDIKNRPARYEEVCFSLDRAC